MPVFQRTGCGIPGVSCTFTTNIPDLIINPDGTCDDLGCPRRTLNYLPVWREMGVTA